MTTSASRAKKRERIATLERRVVELKAQLASTYHFARVGLPKAGNAKGSAVIVQLHYLGGREVCPAFAIRDGLSAETIAALIDDVRVSHQSATELKP